MAVGPLFHPDNRMLSGLTHDFSLFGGQPDPAFTVGPRGAIPAVTDPSDSGHQSPDHPIIDGSDIRLDATTASGTGTDREVDDDASVAFSTSVGDHQLAHEAAVDVDVAVSGPPGGSSTAPDVLASLTPHPDTAPVQNAVAPNTAASEAAGLAADQVGEGIIPVVGSLTGAGLTLAGLVSGHLGANVLDGASHAGGVVSSGVVSTVDGVASTVEDIGSSLTAATSTGDALLHGLDDIGGGDPAGGITTLVGMVNTVDQFAVATATPAHAIEPAASIVDDLIGGNDGSALLGGVDAHLDPAHLTHTTDPVDHILGGL